MKAEVVLINPPLCPGHKPFYSMPPLGVTYLGTVLKKSGMEACVIDAEHEGLDLDRLVQRVISFSPRVIGISVMTPVLPFVLELTKRIKSESGHIRICLGGPHISATLGESFSFSKDVDYLFTGEGEITFAEFIKSGYSPAEYIEGIAYLTDDKIVYNPKIHYIEDLDDLPYPDFDLIDNFNLSSYRIPYANRCLFLPVMASRGCYHNCTFCSVHNIHGKKLRTRSPENVFGELEQRYVHRGVRYFVFKDSSLTLNKSWIERFCCLIVRNKLPVYWRCNARSDEVSEELLRLMKKAGCNLITYGIESGSEYILNRLKKGLKVHDNIRALNQTHKVGIQTHSIYIIGSPGESIKTISETISFAIRHNSLFVQFGKGIAYPGTEFYEWGIKNRTLEDRFWYLHEKPIYKESFLINPHCGGVFRINGVNQEYWIKLAMVKYYFRIRYILKFIYASFKNPFLFLNAIFSISAFIKWSFSKEPCGQGVTD